MKDWIQDAPLSLHGSIIFHFHLCFSPLDSILLIDRNQVGKEQRIGTLSTVFRLDTDEQKVDNLGLWNLMARSRCHQPKEAACPYDTSAELWKGKAS